VTGKADFQPDEWDLVLEGPTFAGTLAATAQRGGTFRESFALAKAYAEARKQHGESQLLDEIAATKPKLERYHSTEEMHEKGLPRLKQAVELVEQKGTPEEVEAYRRFVLAVAERVAEAHKENGQQVSPNEQAAIDEIAATIGASG
jgi:hypothetical protein